MSEVAFYGTHWLINLTLPRPEVPRPNGLIRSLPDLSAQQSTEHAQWPVVGWRVDGKPVSAATWAFAGAWTAITDDLPDVYLVVVGFGIEPDGLDLERITDGRPYGFDLSAPLRLGDLRVARDQSGPAVLASPNTDRFHADQLALISPE